MVTKNNNFVVSSNTGMVELERVVANLYSKGLCSKDEIKEFINNLKLLVENLPERKENHLH